MPEEAWAHQLEGYPSLLGSWLKAKLSSASAVAPIS